MELFVTGGLFLIIVFWVRTHFKGVKVILPEEMETEEDIFVIPSPKNYEEETKKKVEELTRSVDEFGLTQEMKEEVQKTMDEIAVAKEYWENQKKELEKLIEERKIFITTETMYPRNYALSLSDIEVARDKVEEYEMKNPLKKDYEMEKLIEKEKKLVSEFLKTKKRIEEEMESMKEFEKTLSGKTEEVAYFSEKQKMFLNLMNGDTKKAKESLNKIQKKIKPRK